jgi:hypothetical protein
MLQLERENNQRINQMLNQMFDMLKKQTEELAKNKSVTVCFLPGDYFDSYKAFVVMSSDVFNDFTIYYYYSKEDDPDFTVLKRRNCIVSGQHVFLPSVLKPGHKLVIKSNDAEAKILFSGKIPEKGTSKYIDFQTEAQSNVAMVNNYLSGISGQVTVPDSPVGSSAISSSRSRDQIHTEINKTKRLRADAIRNQKNDTSISGSVRWNSIIVDYDRKLIDLEEELSKATK